MNAVSVGAMPRGGDPQSLKFDVATAIDDNVEHLAVK